MPFVRDIMSPDPATCTPDTSIQEVARLMVDFDCGAIPVCKSEDDDTPIGMITDRDIVCRLVAQGRNPLDCDAHDCFTSPCVTVRADVDMTEARDLMRYNKIRRIAVVDDSGCCCGMVSMADIVRALGDVDVVRDVSEPTETPSEVASEEKIPEPA